MARIRYMGKAENRITGFGLIGQDWVTIPDDIAAEYDNPEIKEEGWEIFDAMRKKKSKLPDLPSFFSIPANKILENPESLRLLKVNLKREKEEVETP